jgi:hypothetical protein
MLLSTLLVITLIPSSSAASSSPAANRLSLALSPSASCQWSLLLDSQPYLEKGETFYREYQQTYSDQTGAEAPLEFIQYGNNIGVDSIGEYNETSCVWTTTGPGGEATFVTAFRVYTTVNAVRFLQSFPQGASSTNTSDRNTLISSFPSFARDESFGFLSYSGDFLKYTAAGVWTNTSAWNEVTISSGLMSGPTLLFKAASPLDVATLAPFDEFMAASQMSVDNQLQMGVLGSITSLPVDYTLSTLLYLGSSGIHSTIQEWGTLMRQEYGKKDRGFDADETVNWLGYNTDNGAYYYYLTEPNKTYEETLLDVYADSIARDIPYKMILLDSWWVSTRVNACF